MTSLRTLALVRHAQAGGGFYRDKDRPLTPAGEAQALELGRRLVGTITPQVIVHSSAKRTTQTAKALAHVLKVADLRSDEGLYTDWVDDIIALIREFDDEWSDVAIVGHQPTIGETAWELTHDDATGPVATATALVLAVDGPWSEVAAGTCRLVAREHADPAR